jgi:ATP-dependent protease HslVU (ClpYQ) peptidase subunit
VTVIAALVTSEGAWMGGDSLSSNIADCLITSTPKVLRIGKRVVGCAGGWNAISRFTDHIRSNPEISLEALARTLEHDDEVSALVIEDRRIFLFEGSGCREAVSRNGISYATVGSGGPIAVGALFATVNDTDPRFALKLALQAAEEHSPWCRRPFRIVKAP